MMFKKNKQNNVEITLIMKLDNIVQNIIIISSEKIILYIYIFIFI